MVALEGGRYATSDLNDLYRRVINRNNRLKKLLGDQGAGRHRPQREAHAAGSRGCLDRQFGALRHAGDVGPAPATPLARRHVERANRDGSARTCSANAWIIPAVRSSSSARNLKFDECGVPKQMALELFRPFVISEIIKQGLAHNIRSAGRFIEEHLPEVLAILEEVIKGKRVLLNRAPTLHRLSVQAFKPMLIEGLAMKIPPLVCPAFNADFDGDQMAIHLPLGDGRPGRSGAHHGIRQESFETGERRPRRGADERHRARHLLSSRARTKRRRSMHHFSSYDEAMLAYQFGVVKIQTPIMWQGMETTVGPHDLQPRAQWLRDPYVNDTMTKKKLNKMLNGIFESHGVDAARETIDRVKLLGFEMATDLRHHVGDLGTHHSEREERDLARSGRRPWRRSRSSSRKDF